MLLEKLKLEDGLKTIAPSLAELTHHLLQERNSALQTPIPRPASQEITQFRVPGKVVKRCSSQRSYSSQLQIASCHSGSSQELRIYDQPSLALPPPEIRTDFMLQDLPYRSRAAPLSPSQHSISSQETVPFRLPPHHPMANAHLTLQQHPVVSQQSYDAQNYESHSEPYTISDNRGISVMTPAESCVIQEEVPFQNPKIAVSAHSHVSTSSQDFRMPRIPSQQVLTSEERAASWTSRHSSASSGSRSSRSNKSSLHSSVHSESRGSVASASSKQFTVPGHSSYQVPAYNKSSAVRLNNHKDQQQYAATAIATKSQHTSCIIEEDSVAASRFRDEGSPFRAATPCSNYSEYSASSRNVVVQDSFIGDAVNPQLHFQQTELAGEFVAPQNPSLQQQEQQQQSQDSGFIR
ncbi:hypothetical protein X798_07376, partial [Onchocerca flexuosa]